MDLSAVILAGGESRRMGRDKAWIELDGISLLLLAVDKVRQAGIEDIFISGRAGGDYSALRCPVLFDLDRGFGPMGGIERGLHRCTAPLLLVLAVDLPLMTGAFLQSLAKRCDPRTGVVPELEGRLEPLAAIYPKRCHAFALAMLTHGHRVARDFAERCLREQTAKRWAVPVSEASCLANWNSPNDALWCRGTLAD
jgi:molybdopterin-guanine dinucleotide biosynthesis protein A